MYVYACMCVRECVYFCSHLLSLLLFGGEGLFYDSTWRTATYDKIYEVYKTVFIENLFSSMWFDVLFINLWVMMVIWIFFSKSVQNLLNNSEIKLVFTVRGKTGPNNTDMMTLVEMCYSILYHHWVSRLGLLFILIILPYSLFFQMTWQNINVRTIMPPCLYILRKI